MQGARRLLCSSPDAEYHILNLKNGLVDWEREFGLVSKSLFRACFSVPWHRFPTPEPMFKDHATSGRVSRPLRTFKKLRWALFSSPRVLQHDRNNPRNHGHGLGSRVEWPEQPRAMGSRGAPGRKYTEADSRFSEVVEPVPPLTPCHAHLLTLYFRDST